MAKNLFKVYEVDKTRETQGVEIEVDGVYFVCRRAGGNNRLYRAAISEHSERLAAQLTSTDKKVQLDAEDEVTLQAFADTVVIGWREVLDRNDQPWDFSRDNFLELMRACPDVWLALRMRARDLDNFRFEETKKAGEELGKSSSGIESTEQTSNDTKPSETPVTQ